MDQLVQIYDNTLTSDFCQYVIDQFEKSSNTIEGVTSGGVRPNVKSSTDLMITHQLEDESWSFIYDYLRENLLGNFVDYLSKNPFLGVGDNFSSKVSLVRTAQAAFMSNHNGYPHMQMQRYVNDQGYYAWHHENEGGDSVNRQVFFIYYLNSIQGGETEFKFNSQKVEPVAGRLLLAPCFWTHRHRGNAPHNDQVKYIITGWVSSINHNLHIELEQDYLM